MSLSLNLNPRKLAVALSLIAVLLGLQSIYADHLLVNILGKNSDTALARLLELFSINTYESVPTWYSVILFFLAASLPAWIALAGRAPGEPGSRYWTGLALAFLYISLDKGTTIHEATSHLLRSLFRASGPFQVAWLILGSALAGAVGILYARFWWRLPGRARLLFVLAAAVYVSGALGLEALSTRQYYLDDGKSFPYLVISSVEETVETLGAVAFIYAMLDYLHQRERRLASQTQARPSAEFSGAQPRWSLSPRRAAVGLAVLVLLVNGGLLLWSVA
ncbi:MAG: hypothetical protein KJ047_08010 [Anaerolineae bacterium]|nr:hypothetical protein [Anaerolineae bacterium]